MGLTYPPSAQPIADSRNANRVTPVWQKWFEQLGRSISITGSIAVSAGTQSVSSGTIVFSNANGLTFGMAGSQTITGSHNGLTSQSNQAFSAQGGSSTFQTLSFNNANGLTFSNVGGAVQASYTVPSTAGLLSNINVSAGTTSNNLSAVTFSNANNVSFGLNGSTLTASATVASTQGSINLSAGTTSNLASAFTFANGSNVSFGLNASTITASVATSLTAVNLSAGTTSNNLSAFVFSNSNNVSFGLNGSTVTATATVATSLTNIRVSAGTTSNLLSALTFADSNGMAFGINASTITASYTVPTQTNQTGGIYVTAQSTGQSSSSTYDLRTLSFVPDGIISAGWSNGSFRVSATQSNQAFSAAGGSSAFQTLSFVDTNGVSFTNTNGGAGVASVKLSLYAVSNTTQSSSGTANHTAMSFAGAGVASVGVTGGTVVVSVPAGGGGLTNVNLSAGTTSNNLSNFVFSNSNNVSFGLNGSTVTATATVATSLTNVNISAGTTSNNLSAWKYADSNGVSFGLNASTVTATVKTDYIVTASYYANLPNFQPMVTGASAIVATSGSSIFVQPFMLPYAISASFLRLLYSFNDSAVGTAGTTSANTTFSVERYTTIAAAVYSQGVGANSLSIQSVTSSSAGITGRTSYSAGAQGSQYTIGVSKTYPRLGANTDNYGTTYAVSSGSIVISSNSNTLFTGPRFLDIPWANSLSPGAYWLAIGASTSSASNSSNISFAGTAGMALSLAGVSQSNVSVGVLGAATSASAHQMFPGLGVWTTNASKISTDSMGIHSISQLASNLQVPFQFIRRA